MMHRTLFLSILTLLASCSSRGSSLDDITNEVIAKDRGVTIDIEPGEKK